MIVVGLGGSKIDQKRNDLRIYESLVRGTGYEATIYAIWAMRYTNLLLHSYKMKMSKDAFG